MNKKEVLRLEALAKLRLNEDERQRIASEINEVIGCFNMINELDTEGIEPLSHCSELKNVLRTDKPLPSLSAEAITANANAVDGFFAVPITVEGEE